MKNVIFMHAANMDYDKYGAANHGHCQNILNIMKSYIEESNIMNAVDEIKLNVVGNPNIEFDVEKTQINYLGSDCHVWEFPTLNMIREYSKNNPDDNVLYIHTQGVSYPPTKLVEDRREYLLYQNVIRYKECIALLETNDTVGAMLIHDPVTHYSQNFWWSKCSYINTLIPPEETALVFDERHKCEFWLCGNKDGKFASINNLYNHYMDAGDFSKHLYR